MKMCLLCKENKESKERIGKNNLEQWSSHQLNNLVNVNKSKNIEIYMGEVS